MNPRTVAKIAFKAAIAWLALVISSPGQDVVIQPPFSEPPNRFLFKWDQTQSILTFYRNVKSPVPAVKAYSETGTPGALISPLTDFPNDEELYIWDVAATPQAGIAISAMFNEKGNGKLWSRLLFYNASGVLTKVWNVFPYELERIVADNDGNLYGFGDRVDIPAAQGNPNYPVLFKYSSEGKVLRELLWRDTFPPEQEFLASSSPVGQHLLFLAQNTLVLYVSTTGDLFIFDIDGHLRKKANLSLALSRFMAEIGGSQPEVMALVPVDESNQQFLAQVKCRVEKNTGADIVFTSLRIASDGSSWTKLGSTTNEPQPGVLLGSGGTGMVFLNSNNAGYILLQRPGMLE